MSAHIHSDNTFAPHFVGNILVWREEDEVVQLAPDRTSVGWKTLERHATFARRLEIEARLLSARTTCEERFPAATAEKRMRGCTEVVWDAETDLALACKDALEAAVAGCALYECGDGMYEAVLKASWEAYVRARLRFWRQGQASWKYETPAALFNRSPVKGMAA